MPSPENEAARSDALLLEIARRSLAHAVETGRPLDIDVDALPDDARRPGACFVTLRGPDGSLRGCIGSLEPERALALDVAEITSRAALRDPRFDPVQKGELAGLELHLAVLTPMERLDVDSREALIAGLEPGRDGLVLAEGSRRATFLPAVWESLPEPERFVSELERKAGLAPAWGPRREAWRYTTRDVH